MAPVTPNPPKTKEVEDDYAQVLFLDEALPAAKGTIAKAFDAIPTAQ